jgi:quercetin dioxygenase-like cupin family protein
MHRFLAPTLLVTAALVPGTSARAADATRMVVVPHDGAKWAPADPARPEGTQVAVLSGDPATGPSAMLMKMKKTDGVLHVHSSDYHLVVLEGSMKHWTSEAERTGGPALGPGSYWFQPGEAAHGDSCLSDTCTMFITWAGKRDGRLATSPTAAATKASPRP